MIEIYNLDKYKVIVVGDNMNDVEFLDVVIIVFCLENVLKEVKEYVDYIIVDNENYVVYYIVKWIEENGNIWWVVNIYIWIKYKGIVNGLCII